LISKLGLGLDKFLKWQGGGAKISHPQAIHKFTNMPARRNRLNPISIGKPSHQLDLATVVVKDYLSRLNPDNTTNGVLHYLTTEGTLLQQTLNQTLQFKRNGCQLTDAHKRQVLPRLTQLLSDCQWLRNINNQRYSKIPQRLQHVSNTLSKLPDVHNSGGVEYQTCQSHLHTLLELIQCFKRYLTL
jgi:hypothetical protein